MRKNKENILFITKELGKISSKKKNIVQVSKYLGTSRQTISKWFTEFKRNKKLKPKIHTPLNKIPTETNEKIISCFGDYILEINKRFGKDSYWLPTLRYFKTRYNIDVSTEHIRKILIKNNFSTHRTQRKTRRKIKQNIRDSLRII